MSLTTVNLDQATLTILDESAAFRSLSREDMLRAAINEADSYDRYYRSSVMEGLRDLEEGRLISDEQMQADMSALFQKLETDRPES